MEEIAFLVTFDEIYFNFNPTFLHLLSIKIYVSLNYLHSNYDKQSGSFLLAFLDIFLNGYFHVVYKLNAS